MDKYLRMKEEFYKYSDKDKAISMSKYMKDQFEYYGISAPIRKQVYKDFLKEEKKNKMIDWTFLDLCYEDNHREFQYLVYDYLLSMKRYLTYDDISHIKTYILKKSWWDTIDFLCKVIGSIKDDRVKELMLGYASEDNIWIKRTAILHQLGFKDKTDTELLETIILKCTGTKEFFINKAIGWALRDYSKYNPEYVKDFIERYSNQLHSLSIKEASKYIKR